MIIIDAKKVIIDAVTLQPIPSEIGLDIFTFTHLYFQKLIRVFILLLDHGFLVVKAEC